MKKQNRLARFCGSTNPKSRDKEEGSATVELAIVFPIIIFCLIAVAFLGMVAVEQGKVCDLARNTARAHAIAMGETVPLPGEATVTVDRSEKWIKVQVSRTVNGPVGLTGLKVNCQATALKEPSYEP